MLYRARRLFRPNMIVRRLASCCCRACNRCPFGRNGARAGEESPRVPTQVVFVTGYIDQLAPCMKDGDLTRGWAVFALHGCWCGP
jgi:hypothetical protein